MKSSIITVALLILLFHESKLNAQKGGSSSDSKYAPTFTYKPETRVQVANTGITIAIIPILLSKTNTEDVVSPLKPFSSALQSEIEVLLIAKGYKIKGPFKSRDEMVFSDKKQSDFTLMISVNWDAKHNRDWKKIFGPGGFKVRNGDVTVQCDLDITAVSNFSGEKLWKKHLTLPQQHFTYEGSKDWDYKDVPFWTEYNGDKKLGNPMSRSLEDTYKQAMQLLWNQFDIDEMKSVVEEAKKERTPDNRKKEN